MRFKTSIKKAYIVIGRSWCSTGSEHVLMTFRLLYLPVRRSGLFLLHCDSILGRSGNDVAHSDSSNTWAITFSSWSTRTVLFLQTALDPTVRISSMLKQWMNPPPPLPLICLMMQYYSLTQWCQFMCVPVFNTVGARYCWIFNFDICWLDSRGFMSSAILLLSPLRLF